MAIRRAATALVLVLATVVVTTVARPEPAGGQEPVRYVPPVDAPVVDPFRPPANRFGAGNRGLTYDLPSGTPVRAAAAGQVTFAGTVAGTRHVTVLHPDGLRTSYSFLESVGVQRGDAVAQGDVLGTAGAGFHLGVRSGDAYLDPAALFAGVEVRVRLVPHEEPLPPTDAGLLRERIALLEKVRERGLLERVRDFAMDAGTEGLELVGAGLEVYDQLSGGTLLVEVGTNLADGIRSRRECTPEHRDPPTVDASGRIAVLVAGHGSSSEHASVDELRLDEVGYRSSDVLRYSYAGGRVPDPDGALAPALSGITARPYEAPDTWGDLVAEGRDLADLVEEVAAARPGATIDLYAHSQGGIVTRLALAELAERPGGTAVLGQVVTMGTPHDGTDLATAARLLTDQDRTSIETLARLAGTELRPDALAVSQMSEASVLIQRLQVEGVPDGVDLRTIGARGDLVVTGDKTSVDGHHAAMLDLVGLDAHEDIPGSTGAIEEIALGLAGLPPSCRSVADLLLDAAVPEVISFAENAAVAGYLI